MVSARPGGIGKERPTILPVNQLMPMQEVLIRDSQDVLGRHYVIGEARMPSVLFLVGPTRAIEGKLGVASMLTAP